MNANQIQLGLMHWVRRNSSEIVVPNYFLGRFEADLLKVTKNGLFIEYEIKTSKADFRKDAEKAAGLYMGWKEPLLMINKHDQIREGKHVHRFFFVVPKGLIDITEVPTGFGLITVESHKHWSTGEEQLSYSVAKSSKMFKAEKCSVEQYKHIATNLCFKLEAAKKRISKKDKL